MEGNKSKKGVVVPAFKHVGFIVPKKKAGEQKNASNNNSVRSSAKEPSLFSDETSNSSTDCSDYYDQFFPLIDKTNISGGDVSKQKKMSTDADTVGSSSGLGEKPSKKPVFFKPSSTSDKKSLPNKKISAAKDSSKNKKPSENGPVKTESKVVGTPLNDEQYDEIFSAVMERVSKEDSCEIESNVEKSSAISSKPALKENQQPEPSHECIQTDVQAPNISEKNMDLDVEADKIPEKKINEESTYFQEQAQSFNKEATLDGSSKENMSSVQKNGNSLSKSVFQRNPVKGATAPKSPRKSSLFHKKVINPMKGKIIKKVFVENQNTKATTPAKILEKQDRKATTPAKILEKQDRKATTPAKILEKQDRKATTPAKILEKQLKSAKEMGRVSTEFNKSASSSKNESFDDDDDSNITKNHFPMLNSQMTAWGRDRKIIYEPPPTTKNYKESLIYLQKSRNIGLWIQCTNKHCSKWRYCRDIQDPLDVPKIWVCSMNSDIEFNDCNCPEQRQPDELIGEVDFIESKYSAGSIVVAKVDGYPWWPAMVDDDPNVHQFYWLTDRSKVPDWYHVVFFDSENVSRAWVTSRHVQPYDPNHNYELISNMTKKEKSAFASRIDKAIDDASRASALSLARRLEEYGFIKRFFGPIRKPRNLEESDESCEDEEWSSSISPKSDSVLTLVRSRKDKKHDVRKRKKVMNQSHKNEKITKKRKISRVRLIHASNGHNKPLSSTSSRSSLISENEDNCYDSVEESFPVDESAEIASEQEAEIASEQEAEIASEQEAEIASEQEAEIASEPEAEIASEQEQESGISSDDDENNNINSSTNFNEQFWAKIDQMKAVDGVDLGENYANKDTFNYSTDEIVPCSQFGEGVQNDKKSFSKPQVEETCEKNDSSTCFNEPSIDCRDNIEDNNQVITGEAIEREKDTENMNLQDQTVVESKIKKSNADLDESLDMNDKNDSDNSSDSWSDHSMLIDIDPLYASEGEPSSSIDITPRES